MEQAINEMVQIVANGGILGTCNALCSQLNNSIADTICDLVCAYEGITEFINLLESEDPDPVWFCMIGDACPINDKVSGIVNNVTVSPVTGKQGTTFTLTASYTTKTDTSSTGTLDVLFEVVPPSQNDSPFGWDTLVVSSAPGTFQVQQTFQATPQEGESFGPGTYQVVFAVCEGTCGCIHSHCYTIAQRMSSFKLTN